MARRKALLAVLLLLLPALLAAQSVGNRSSPQQSSYCAVPKVKSYLDITLDPANGKYTAFVYNLSANYNKTGIPKALVYRINMSNLSDINICYEVTGDGTSGTELGRVSFSYDPNAEGCSDFWIIFCPVYTAGGGVPNPADREACLGGTAIPHDKYDDTHPTNPCKPSSLPPENYATRYIPSHNELYFCNHVPKDFAPLCWPLMLIFAILVGASFALGRNPFHAFDFGATRMSRGRQYTARVQQKSFDIMGYLAAMQTGAGTAEKITGAKEGSFQQYTPLGALGKGVGALSKALRKALTPKDKEPEKKPQGAALKPGDKVKPPAKKPADQKPKGFADEGRFATTSPSAPSSAQAEGSGLTPTIAGAVGGGLARKGRRVIGVGSSGAALPTAYESGGGGGAARTPQIGRGVLPTASDSGGGGGGLGGERKLPTTQASQPSQMFQTMYGAPNIFSEIRAVIGVLSRILSRSDGITPGGFNFTFDIARIRTEEEKHLDKTIPNWRKDGLTFGQSVASAGRQFGKLFELVFDRTFGSPRFENLFKLSGSNFGERLLDLLRKIIANAVTLHKLLATFSGYWKAGQALGGRKGSGISWFENFNNRTLFSLPMPKLGGFWFIPKFGGGKYDVSIGMFGDWMRDTSTMPYGLRELFGPTIDNLKLAANKMMAPSSDKNIAPGVLYVKGNSAIILEDGGMRVIDLSNPERQMTKEDAVGEMFKDEGEGKAFRRWLKSGNAPNGADGSSIADTLTRGFGFREAYYLYDTSSGKLEIVDADTFSPHANTVAAYKEANLKLVDAAAADAWADVSLISNSDRKKYEHASEYERRARSETGEKDGILSLGSLEFLLQPENYSANKNAVGKALDRLVNTGALYVAPATKLSDLNEKELEDIRSQVKDLRKTYESVGEKYNVFNSLQSQANALRMEVQALRGIAEAAQQPDSQEKFELMQFYQQYYSTARQEEMWARLALQVAVENGHNGVMGRVEEYLKADKEGKQKIREETEAERDSHFSAMNQMAPEENLAGYSSELLAKMRLDAAINLMEKYGNSAIDANDKKMLLHAFDVSNANMQEDINAITASYGNVAKAWENAFQLHEEKKAGALMSYMSSALEKVSIGQGQAYEATYAANAVLEEYNRQVSKKLADSDGDIEKVQNDAAFCSKMELLLGVGAHYSEMYVRMHGAAGKGTEAKSRLDNAETLFRIVSLLPENKLQMQFELPYPVSSDGKSFTNKVTVANVQGDPEAYAPYMNQLLAYAAKAKLEELDGTLKKRQAGGDYEGSPFETVAGAPKTSSVASLIDQIENANRKLDEAIRSASALAKPNEEQRKKLYGDSTPLEEKASIGIELQEKASTQWAKVAADANDIARWIDNAENQMYITSKKSVNKFVSEHINEMLQPSFLGNPEADFINIKREELGLPKIQHLGFFESYHSAVVDGMRKGLDISQLESMVNSIGNKPEAKPPTGEEGKSEPSPREQKKEEPPEITKQSSEKQRQERKVEEERQERERRASGKKKEN